jgi:hypothetical protein
MGGDLKDAGQRGDAGRDAAIPAGVPDDRVRVRIPPVIDAVSGAG